MKHQRFVGTGYFDQVQQVISGGAGVDHGIGRVHRSGTVYRRNLYSIQNAVPMRLFQPVLGKIPQMPINIDPGPEEMLLPSGD